MLLSFQGVLNDVSVLVLVGLKHLESLNLNGCKYVTDVAKLLPVQESLVQLDIGNCNGILDISPLTELKCVQ